MVPYGIKEDAASNGRRPGCIEIVVSMVQSRPAAAWTFKWYYVGANPLTMSSRLTEVLFVVFLALAMPGRAQPILRNPLPVPIQNGLVLLQADFNGDGHDDVVIGAGSGSVNISTVAVHLANGSGPLGPAVVTNLPTQSVDYRKLEDVGDVNGDGNIDLLFSFAEQNSSQKKLQTMLGNGDGTFQAGASSELAYPLSLTHAVLGDFTGNASLDVAAVVPSPQSFAADAVVVLVGNGTGQFSGGTTTTLEGSAMLSGLTAGDLNADGENDLVAQNSYGAGNARRNRILIGNGAGAFVQVGTTSYGNAATGDFNEDGRLDVAVAVEARGNGPSWEYGLWQWFIEISLTNVDGSPGNPTRYPSAYHEAELAPIAVADINGDGNADVVSAGMVGGAVSLLRGTGDGGFEDPLFFLSGPKPWAMAVADFDWDGDIDVLTLSYPEIGSLPALSFVPGNGDGTLQSYRAFHMPWAVAGEARKVNTSGGVAADMNKDGKLDVVVIMQRPDNPVFHLAVMLNDEGGELGAPILSNTGQSGFPAPAFAIADLDEDGKLDAVVVSQVGTTPSAAVLLGMGDGHFGSWTPLAVASIGRPTLGHFNGDSHVDLFLASDTTAAVHPGSGTGTFGAAVISSVDARDVIVGDVNGDGKEDYVSSSSGPILVCINDGTGRFASSSIREVDHSAQIAVEHAALADFDGNGVLDVLMTTASGTETLLGNGDGTFAAPISMRNNTLSYGRPVTTADFDGDGKTDVAFAASIYVGNGDGTFRSRARFRISPLASLVTGLKPTFVAAADLDENGSADLVLVNTDADEVEVFLTRTTADPTLDLPISLSADLTAPRYGDSIKFTALVPAGPILKTGVIVFKIDGTPAALIDGSLFQTAVLTAGQHEIEATYTGDENYLPSTTTMTLTVAKASPAISVSGSPNPQSVGGTVILRALIVAPGPAAPSGTFTFRDGDTPLDVPVTNGEASVNTLTAETHLISADYSGDANFEPATGSYSQQITKPVPQLNFSTSPPSDQLIAGGDVEVHAYFQDTTDITGSIKFYSDSVLLGTVPLTEGVANLITQFTWGDHLLRIEYSGDTNWAAVALNRTLQIHIGPWGTPLAVKASASVTGSVAVLWSRVFGAASYTLWRRNSLGTSWIVAGTFAANVSSTSQSIPPQSVRMYAISATDGDGNASPLSAPDLATAVGFADATITPGVTPIKGRHFTDLRTAIGYVRTFAGLAAYSYSTPTLSGQPVRAVDTLELRTAIAEARAACGVAAVTFTDSSLSPSVEVRALHVLELRTSVD
jgi:hypothetical protein